MDKIALGLKERGRLAMAVDIGSDILVGAATIAIFLMLGDEITK